DCASLDGSATCATSSTLASSCMVHGLRLRNASLPDASVGTGGSSGRNAGNGGAITGGSGAITGGNGGAIAGGRNDGGAIAGGRNDGGASTGGRAASGGSQAGGDAGSLSDAGQGAGGAGGETTHCAQGEHVCRCASGAYCLAG